jgi:transcriptional regulator GlxA family with amidase domain
MLHLFSTRTTITTFIMQHRISHAQRLLITTIDSILDVALSAGFQSLSRFNAIGEWARRGRICPDLLRTPDLLAQAAAG